MTTHENSDNSMKRYPLTLGLLAFLAIGLFAQPAWAALNTYVAMTLNGEAITGEVTLATIGGVDVSANHLECTAINHEIFGGDTGKLGHTPFKMIKRVDKASPLLYRALDNNETVTATIKYFNNDPDSGVTKHFFSAVLTGGRVSAIRQWIPNSLDPTGAFFPPMEEISITYQSIEFVNIGNGAAHTITTN